MPYTLTTWGRLDPLRSTIHTHILAAAAKRNIRVDAKKLDGWLRSEVISNIFSQYMNYASENPHHWEKEPLLFMIKKHTLTRNVIEDFLKKGIPSSIIAIEDEDLDDISEINIALNYQEILSEFPTFTEYFFNKIIEFGKFTDEKKIEAIKKKFGANFCREFPVLAWTLRIGYEPIISVIKNEVFEKARVFIENFEGPEKEAFRAEIEMLQEMADQKKSMPKVDELFLATFNCTAEEYCVAKTAEVEGISFQPT